MKILIAGAGKVGYNIAKNLMIRHEVIVIDQNEEAITNIQEHLDVLALNGNIENPHILQTLPQEIDLFIAVTDMDEVNLLSSLIIDSVLHVKKKIIRLKNHFFDNDHIKGKLAIDEMIFPYVDAADPFKYIVDFPYIRNVKTFKHTKGLLVSTLLPEHFEMVMIEHWREKTDQRLVVAGIERDEKFFVPHSTEMLLPNDLVYLFAYPGIIKSLYSELFDNCPPRVIKNCMIMGANPLGIEIAKVLNKKGVAIQMIDQNLNHCQQANQILKNKVTVLRSSYESEHFIKESSSHIDLFISAIEQDEYNITQCMMAKKHGIKKIVGINNNRGYSSLMRALGIEVVRGTKINAFHSILEMINSSSIIVQKTFCGGEGTVLLRKIFHQPSEIKAMMKIPPKLESKCSFFLIRHERIYIFSEISHLEENDLLLLFAPEALHGALENWLDQVL